MGIAAYNRGSRVITRQIEADLTPFEECPGAAAIRERLDSIAPGKVRLFQSTVARPAPGLSGGWLLMNRKDRGYGEYALPFPTLDAIRQAFAIILGAYGKDEHGPYWNILVV